MSDTTPTPSTPSGEQRSPSADGDGAPKKRRRGSRGGRNRKKKTAAASSENGDEPAVEESVEEPAEEPAEESVEEPSGQSEPAAQEDFGYVPMSEWADDLDRR